MTVIFCWFSSLSERPAGQRNNLNSSSFLPDFITLSSGLEYPCVSPENVGKQWRIWAYRLFQRPEEVSQCLTLQKTNSVRQLLCEVASLAFGYDRFFWANIFTPRGWDNGEQLLNMDSATLRRRPTSTTLQMWVQISAAMLINGIMFLVDPAVTGLYRKLSRFLRCYLIDFIP